MLTIMNKLYIIMTTIICTCTCKKQKMALNFVAVGITITEMHHRIITCLVFTLAVLAQLAKCLRSFSYYKCKHYQNHAEATMMGLYPVVLMCQQSAWFKISFSSHQHGWEFLAMISQLCWNMV